MSLFIDILELIKIRILVFSLLNVIFGYLLTIFTQPAFNFLSLVFLVVGLVFVFSGSASLNHLMEVKSDQLMLRTQNRPLPQQRLSKNFVRWFVILNLLIGFTILFFYVGLNTTLVSFAIVFLYGAVYTPLKKVSPVNTFIGAIPGALPVFCGWFAVTNNISFDILLFFIIFYVWQLPHFFAIDWISRFEYKKAGIKMLSGLGSSGIILRSSLFVSSCLFIVLTVIPFFLDIFGWLYLLFVFVSGSYLFYFSLLFIKNQSDELARKILKLSIVYPPIFFVCVLIETFLFLF